MKFVVDTNVLISALIKDSKTREIIINKNLDLITPSYSLGEINKYQKEICKKGKFSQQEYFALIDILFNYVKIININYYLNYLDYSKNLVEDIGDAPFLALALASKSYIWSDDKHLKNQKEIRVLTTKEIIKLTENKK